jgi:1-pyrroline-5-carboxylate dehydrogenase
VTSTLLFRNEPETDFHLPQEVAAFTQALSAVTSQLGRTYSAIIDGASVSSDRTFASISPADPNRVIGHFPDLEPEFAIRAIEAADRAFAVWSRFPGAERVRIVSAAADRVRARRHELSAWMVHEVGKSWSEADGEVAELVDLLEYYGDQMLLLDGPQNERLASLPGETTEFFYVPLGPGVVISPWNFPLALTFGMASAAIVAGNTVVVKPASNSPTTVYQVARIFEEVGLPAGVLNLVTGRGSTIGNVLVDHPRTRFIAFTGSMEVGTKLHERAAKVHPGQIWIKRTVLELGGKNAVIVDREANLDAAADGVVASAFGFQGQKCSARSRAIVDEAIYDEFIPRVLQRVAALRVSDPVDPEVNVGPVIDERACKSVLDYIEIGKSEGTLVEIRRSSSVRAASFTSGTCISTGNRPARSWVCTRSVGSTCRAPTRRQGDRTICCSSCRGSRSETAVRDADYPLCIPRAVSAGVGSHHAQPLGDAAGTSRGGPAVGPPGRSTTGRPEPRARMVRRGRWRIRARKRARRSPGRPPRASCTSPASSCVSNSAVPSDQRPVATVYSGGGL